MPDMNQDFNCYKSCRYGTMIYNIHDTYVGRSLDMYGEFSEGEVELFRQTLRPDDIAVDIGANIGAHTLFMAKAVGTRGRVLAFEPQRIVFQALCANMAINSITNVYCHQVALGETSGSLIVPPLDYSQENNYGGLELGHFSQGETVPVRRLDELELPACRMIKIDVEGMEKRVLEGSVETIRRFRPALYVENDRKDRSANLIRYIDSLGYAMFWHTPKLFNSDNFFKNPQNVFGDVVSINMLCLPKEAAINVSGFPPVGIPAGQ